MSGIYVHIPFCRSKCAYCDFFSMPLHSALQKSNDIMATYCNAILAELDLRRHELPQPVTTLYIGGGTPTTLPLPLLVGLIERISEKTGLARIKQTEITVEANPEDITPSSIESLLQAGVNRISIGIQSFDNAQLTAIHRLHDAPSSIRAMHYLSESGINYSADLIYGLPGQSIESWTTQLEQLLSFRPPHFSAYLLSYEPGTALYAKLQSGSVSEAPEELALQMYDRLCEIAYKHGYNHYEISNFSLPGKEAKHNSSYWDFTPYLGLGCSAHSFDGYDRRYNPSNLMRYIETISKHKTTAIKEEETVENRINDYIITSLRTAKGLSLDIMTEKWGQHTTDNFIQKAENYLHTGKMSWNEKESCIRISESYWIVADTILRDLII